MQLATSSYRAYTSEMGLAVVTSRGLPRWRMAEAETWPRLWAATPASGYYDAPADVFAEQYIDQLHHHRASILSQLHKLGRETGADRVVMLCFEADVTQCHRDLLACWILGETGEDVPELTREEVNR